MKYFNNLFTVIFTLLIMHDSDIIAKPKLIGSMYFFVGGNDCVTYKLISEGRIMCYDNKGKETQSRENMSDKVLEIHNNY